jgi:hypothetical protein
MATSSSGAAVPRGPAPARLLQLKGVFPEDVEPAPVAARPRARDPDALMQQIMLGQLGGAAAAPRVAERGDDSDDDTEPPSPSSPRGKGAAQIPAYFYGVEQHPARVDGDCWQCGDRCGGFPWFIPRETGSAPPQARAAGGAVPQCRCEGLFCTMACLKAWADLFYSREDTAYREVSAGIERLVREVHGRDNIGHVWAAPDARWALASFCRGRMSRAEYRRQLRNRDARTLAPPRA